MPVSGEVSAINDDLDGTPTLLNASCYEQGWLIRVKPENMADVNSLLSADAYRAQL
jgi:glycine cleavage system H protein